MSFKKLKLTFLSATIMAIMSGASYAADGYLSRDMTAQMTADFTQMLLRATARQPTAVAAFIKKYDFVCKPKAFATQGRLRSIPLTCHVYDETDSSSSPWPTLIIGIENRRIVAASGEEVKSSKVWRCDSVDGRVPICVDKHSTKQQQKKWVKRWDSLFKSAN